MSLFPPSLPNYTSAVFPTPREFQSEAHDALRRGFVDGHKNQMLCAPTGAGKTYLGLRIAHEALLRGKKAIFVCDREALINQTSDVSDKYGLSAHGIIKSDHWRVDRSMPFQIASAQTLDRRGWPEADVIIVDEAHTQYAIWTNHIKSCGAAVIGLSATPFSTGLGQLFTNLVNAATMDRLTKEGVLVPMRVFTCSKPDMDGAKTSGGEWTHNAAAERGMEIIGDVVLEWQKHAEGRKTIIFGANINHCLEIVRQFNEAGIMAAAFTSKTPESERRELLKEYRGQNSCLRVLVSVEALAKGFDVPDVGCVVDCRPLRKSLSTAIQMWGRGLRSSPETGKEDCILLDHSGNIIRFADDYSDFFFNGLDELDSGEKLDKVVRKDDKEKEEKACPLCGFRPMGRRCISCGYEKVVPSLVEHFPGELSEITIGKKKYADNAQHLWEQACTYARSYSAPEKQKGRAAHIYRDITGNWPPSHFSFEDTQNVSISKNVLNKIKARNIAFAVAREKEAA